MYENKIKNYNFDFKNIINKDLEIKFFNFPNCFAFEIENFINDEQYELLKNNLPNIKSPEFKDLNDQFFNLDYQHNKTFYINEINKQNYEKHILSNKVLNNFSSIIKNPDFAKKLINKLYFKILYSRRKDFKNFFRLLFRKNKYGYKDKKSFTDQLFFNHLHTTFEIAYMYNGAESWPHTDGIKKVLSLLMYFPEDDSKEKQFESLGTTFYKSDEFCLKSEDYKINSFEKSREFKKKSILAGSFPYKKKSLFGFIKSHNSWHLVEPFDIKKDFIRKNFNINILLI